MKLKTIRYTYYLISVKPQLVGALDLTCLHARAPEYNSNKQLDK